MTTFTTLALALLFAGETPTLRGLHLDPTDGTADHATIAVTVVPQTGTTVALWFRTSSADAPLFALTDAASLTEDRRIHLRDGRIRVAVTTGSKVGPDELASPADRVLNDGQWHHVAHTLGAGGSRLYVDGVLVAHSGTTTSTFASATQVVLGRGLAATAAYLHGDLDEVRVHTAELTQPEIDAVRRASLTKLPDVYAFFPFDGYAIDKGGRGLTMTLHGGARLTSAGAPVPGKLYKCIAGESADSCFTRTAAGNVGSTDSSGKYVGSTDSLVIGVDQQDN